MKSFQLSKNIFWSLNENKDLYVVVDSDSRIFKLEGIASTVFLAIANNQNISHPNEELIQKVISNLCELNFIQSSDEFTSL